MEQCRKPIIVALPCDIRVAAKRAKFMDTHARFGIFPSWEVTEKLGFVNHVVEEGELLKTSRDIADVIVKNNQDMLLSLRLSSDVDSLFCPTQDLNALHGAVALSQVQSLPHVQTSVDLIENSDVNQIVVPDKRSWRNLFAYMGPGFLVSIAYIDPGNFETVLQFGAKCKYELLWIIFMASCAALVIQTMAANLGVVAGKHLAEHCRAEYSRVTNLFLWVIGEVVIVACDIPEVNGTAFALNRLFNIQVWIGVLLTGLSTLILLALQQYGVRKLEFLIAFLVFTIAASFFVEPGYAKPDAKEVLNGLFVPQLNGKESTGLAISLLGAMVMPHNLFLHSALCRIMTLCNKWKANDTGDLN
ncbi:hypothetical protein RIF29_30928 [Crotalaria pallida]|uniref:Uncharacterized protein n=1 Tax=Crotalaria pallida TaxID=3830 RepID=A0AAN9EH44_CROPI